MDSPPDVDPDDWEEYLALSEEEKLEPMDHFPILTEQQYWALLAVYEPAAETLIEVSDGPGRHVPLMSVLVELGVITQTRWEAVSVARLILERYEDFQMNKPGE